MYNDILSQLGLAKNEAKIYETLLKYGESSVGNIATKANINRRNVYDSINRLIEKGLIFEIRLPHENAYQAVDPKKLMEMIKEKEEALAKIMPELEKVYGSTPHQEDVYIYKGLEGYKNYMRSILQVKQDVYSIGGKGQWSDDKISSFSKKILSDMNTMGIKFHVLFDWEVKQSQHQITKLIKEYRFLPKDFSTHAVIDLFGDNVVITTAETLGKLEDNFSFTVIVNPQIASAFRTWFKFMWDGCK